MDNIIKMKNMSRRKFFKRAARRMLFSDWVCQILAFVIVGALFVGINYFGGSVGIIVSELSENVPLANYIGFLFSFLSLVFVIPVIYGLEYFEIKAVSGKRSELSDIFSVFSDSEKVMRSYTLFFNVLLRCIIGFLPAIVIFFFKTFVYEDGMLGTYTMGNVDLIYLLMNTLLVVFVYLGIVLSSGCFVGVYICVKREDISVEECFYEAKECVKGHRFELAKTAISFLPLFVISLFTIGFLFVMYTIPYMLITFTMQAKYLYDKRNYELNVNCEKDSQP